MDITSTELTQLITIRAKGLESASMNGACDTNTKKGCKNTLDWIKHIKEALNELETRAQINDNKL